MGAKEITKSLKSIIKRREVEQIRLINILSARAAPAKPTPSEVLCWDCGHPLTGNLDNYRRKECYSCFLYSDGHSSK